ncbi:MAG TPA: hypothetical protein VJV78_37365 [Polyangiales bacterium]|nr:hypothetical protein [Polyangiales bacterium]
MALPIPETQIRPGPAKPGAKGDHEAQLQQVAKQFESILVSQLLSVLWKTTPSMGSGQMGQYQEMFQPMIAEHMVRGGGIGLASTIAKGLGAKGDAPEGPMPLHMPAPLPAAVGTERHLTLDATAPSEPGVGVLGDLQRIAAQMLDGGGAARWAKDGKLDTSDLPSVLNTEAPGGVARFSVRDANGYQGYYKCNLFALELARRAGMQVPVVAREAGWGFPSSNRITQDASDGSLDAGWAKVATGASPAAMHGALSAGEAAFLLVGSGQGDRHGHMAVIERPRSIDYDAEGQVQRIVFDGWEAQPGGGKHLTERAWNRLGHSGAPGDRNGLTRIEIIQLSRPHPGERTERTLSDTANSSRLDSVSSNEPRRPTQGGKEHS